MALNYIKPSRGKLLVAEPMLNESYFKRSVILLTEHNENGSIGFILNKQVDLRLNEAIVEFENFNFPLYLGGPVGKDNIFYIHTLGKEVSGSTEVINGIYFGGEFEILKQLMNEGKVNEGNIKFFIGYSGWDPKQLNDELEKNSWIVAHATAESILKAERKTMWSTTLRGMGKAFALLSNFPENPSLN
jgi:putative transcriptional regulator